eukprot:TRINITY_DN20451_c0_g1_i1.p1 TRINITY_DN20451_c0_g1~~TRINITY_DN20451_c0_g1_i1.p1  ORF type:complete len:674 (+),score=234.77 TRINITY_DN20451_c0_g1_i1:80-2101(+)
MVAKISRVWGQRGSKTIEDVASEVAGDAAWAQRVWGVPKGGAAAQDRAHAQILRIWAAVAHFVEMLMSRGRGVTIGVSGCEFCTFTLSRAAWAPQGAAAPASPSTPAAAASPDRMSARSGTPTRRGEAQDAAPSLGVGGSTPHFRLAGNFGCTYSLKMDGGRPASRARRVEASVASVSAADLAQELGVPPEAVRATLKAVICSIGEGLYREQVYDLQFGFARVHLDKRSAPDVEFHPVYLTALQQFDERRLAREKRHEGFLVRGGGGTPMLTEKCHLYPAGWEAEREGRYFGAEWPSVARTPTRAASVDRAPRAGSAGKRPAPRSRSNAAAAEAKKAFCTASAPRSFDQIAKDVTKPHVRPLLSMKQGGGGARPSRHANALLHRQISSVEKQIHTLEHSKQALEKKLAGIEGGDEDEDAPTEATRLSHLAPRQLNAVAPSRAAHAKPQQRPKPRAKVANAELIEKVREAPAEGGVAPEVTALAEGELFAGSPRVEVRSTPRVRVAPPAGRDVHDATPRVVDLETPVAAPAAPPAPAAPLPLQDADVNQRRNPGERNNKAPANPAHAAGAGDWECGHFLKFTDGNALKQRVRSAAVAVEAFNREQAAAAKQRCKASATAANQAVQQQLAAEATAMTQDKLAQLEQKAQTTTMLRGHWTRQMEEAKAAGRTIKSF